MNRIYFFLLWATLLIAFPSCKKPDTGSATPSVTKAFISSADCKVANSINAYKIPGASLAVAENGKQVCRKGPGKANVCTQGLYGPLNAFGLPVQDMMLDMLKYTPCSWQGIDQF